MNNTLKKEVRLMQATLIGAALKVIMEKHINSENLTSIQFADYDIDDMISGYLDNIGEDYSVTIQNDIIKLVSEKVEISIYPDIDGFIIFDAITGMQLDDSYIADFLDMYNKGSWRH